MTQDVRARSQAINKDLAQHLTDSNEPNKEHLENDFVSLLPDCTTIVKKGMIIKSFETTILALITTTK